MSKLQKLTGEQFALDVSAWTDFVDRKTEIIVDMIESAPTLRNLVPVTGCKANTTVEVPILTTDVSWSTDDCVYSATGASTIISKRTAEIVRLSDREFLCVDQMDGVLAKVQKAGANNTEFAYAKAYMELKKQKNAKALETAVWVGDKISGTGNNSKFNGYCTIAKSELSSLAFSGTFSSWTTSNAITQLESWLENRTAAMYEMDDLVVNMSLGYASTLANAILATDGAAGTGIYTNGGQENQLGTNEFRYRNKNIIIRGTDGLSSTNDIFITPDSNLRYLTDLEHEKEMVEMFFDRVGRNVISDMVFAFAVQYEFPSKVIYLEKI